MYSLSFEFLMLPSSGSHILIESLARNEDFESLGVCCKKL